MMKRRELLFMTVACCIAGAAGCSVLDPQPDRTQFYLLTAMAEAPTASAPANMVIALDPVKLPDYLGRLEIATRTDENRLRYSDTDRWAEPLDVSFTRVLSQDLAILMNLGDVVSYPWFSDTRVDFQVPVHVSRFEGDGDKVVLQARWSVKDVKSGTLLYAKESRILQSQAGTGGAAVGAMNAAVTELGREIASRAPQLTVGRS